MPGWRWARPAGHRRHQCRRFRAAPPPRLVTEPLAELAKLPIAAAITAWAMGLWHAAPQAPVFDDLRPFDEF